MGYGTLVATLLVIGSVLAQDGPGPKIFYGNDTRPGEYPFMVSLEWSEDSHYCGGALIEPRIVITAAHCVFDDWGEVPHPSGLHIHVGAWNLSDENAESERMSVGRILPHPDYNGYTIENDIALVILNDPVNTTDRMIGLIDLPMDNSLYAQDTPITVIGWGGTDEGDRVADILQKHEYVVSNQTACNETWSDRGYPVYPGMMCTGEPPLDGHSWFGDSGGPLFTDVGGTKILLGLTSWGDDDPSNYTYDVNTDVWYYKDWIMETVNQSSRPTEFHLLGGDKSSHGIVVYDDFAAFGTICRDHSMGPAEVDAICHHFGYEHGVAADIHEYVTRQKKGVNYYDFDMPHFAVSRMECHENATNIANRSHCHFDPYPHHSPCFDGEQLAVRCADTPWEFEVSEMRVNVLTMPTGYVKGKVECDVHAHKYGMELDMGNEVAAYLLDVVSEEDVEYIKTLKWNKKRETFTAKIKTRDYAEHNCWMCYVELEEQDDFFAFAMEDSCAGDVMAAEMMARKKVAHLRSIGELGE